MNTAIRGSKDLMIKRKCNQCGKNIMYCTNPELYVDLYCCEECLNKAIEQNKN